MSTKSTAGQTNAELFNTTTWLQEFQIALESDAPIRMSEWVSEIPSELRGDLVPLLLGRYLDCYRTKGWTVNLATFVESFPEFEPLVAGLNLASLGGGGVDDTVRTRPLHATTQYQVDVAKWKEGGQGVVHKAVENEIGGRQVVVKYLKDGDHEVDFQKEIEVTARLEHPGVAAVFSRGVDATTGGRPFYAMRLIHGKSLEDRIAEFHNRLEREKSSKRYDFDRLNEQGIGEILESIISAGHTVAHAHSVGVLHCDLKPKNIVCGSFRATIVLDWGSAQSYEVVGRGPSDSTPPIRLPDETGGSHTISYASPEQLARRKLTPASDVFCLGATLYHALTGRAPFGADRQLDSACAAPRQIVRAVPKRLESICLKAMQCTAEARYQQVEEFSRDLTNWMRDEEVSAAPDTITERLFRIARHHKKAAAFGSAALFALMFLGFMAWNLSIQQRMVSASLGSAFSLIEDLCKPLEDDAISNSSEFNLRASQVALFAHEYIREKPKDAKLGEAYELSGLVHFYLHNRARGNMEDEAPSQMKELNLAIGDLENAEGVFRREGKAVSLAENLVRQARWVRKRAAINAENKDSQVSAFNKLIQVVHLFPSPSTSEEIAVVAEANQVLGELTLTNKSALVLDDDYTIGEFEEGQSAEVIQRNVAISVDFYTNAIERLQSAPQTNRRNLARGYGFRGDSYMALYDYARAYEDYTASLQLRKDTYDDLASDENRFQLSRGYGNLGSLAINTPRNAQLAGLDSIAAGKPREIAVFEAYTSQSLKLMKELTLARSGDDRPRTDYRRICNIAAQLHYLASMDDGLTPEQKELYLGEASAFANQAIEDLGDLAVADQDLKNQVVSSYALMIQIAVAREATSRDPSDVQGLEQMTREYAEKVNQLLEVYKKGYENLSNTQLILHAIALAASGSDSKLQGVVKLMAEQGLNNDPYCRKQLNCFIDDSGTGAVIRRFFEE